MNYYDLHVSPSFSEGKSTLDQIIERAKILGFSGICLVGTVDNFKKNMEIRESLSNKEIQVFIGFEARNANELSKLVGMRRDFDALFVRGGDIRLNRMAVETPQVDVLSIPEYDRPDTGLNHIMAKLAAKNDVAIEVNLREILNSFKATRAKIMGKMSVNLMLCKKYGAPVIITSGAISHLHMRDPIILQSFGMMVGLDLEQSINAVSKNPMGITKKSRDRQSEDWIMPGVKVVK
jgi:ribonuclease P/MRP protein subunit RPP1